MYRFTINKMDAKAMESKSTLGSMSLKGGRRNKNRTEKNRRNKNRTEKNRRNKNRRSQRGGFESYVKENMFSSGPAKVGGRRNRSEKNKNKN